MNEVTLNNDTGKPDKGASYNVTLHNGTTATVRNLTLGDMLSNMVEQAEADMKSGDAKIASNGLRWYLIGRAILGDGLDEPVDHYHEVLETKGVAVGETREQYLERMLAERDAQIRKLNAPSATEKADVTDLN